MESQKDPEGQSDKMLPNLAQYTDVFRAVLGNATLIAKDIREHYLPETAEMVNSVRRLVSAEGEGGTMRVAKASILNDMDPYDRTAEILRAMKGTTVAALDGGQGRGLMGSVTPFALRTVTYSVRLGHRGPDREQFSPSSFLVNRLTGGGLGTGEDLLGAIQLLFELRSALDAIVASEYDLFLLHGPLVRSLGQYAIYELSPTDLEAVLGEGHFEEFSRWCQECEKGRKTTINAAGGKRVRSVCPGTGFFGLKRAYVCAVAFVLNRLYDEAKRKRTLIMGIVERTSSTELLQRMMYANWSRVISEDRAWMKKVIGKTIRQHGSATAKAKYIKQFLDNLGYYDPLILGATLKPGDYITPQESRVNRPQAENHLVGLDTGMIGKLEGLSGIIPKSKYTYLRTSPFNSPFRIEMPDWFTKDQEQRVLSAVYAFSQFLPKYAFPVNLDVVDKVAKVSNWITGALMAMLSQEIYEGILKDKPRWAQGDILQLLGGKKRDWNLRPHPRKSLL